MANTTQDWLNGTSSFPLVNLTTTAEPSTEPLVEPTMKKKNNNSLVASVSIQNVGNGSLLENFSVQLTSQSENRLDLHTGTNNNNFTSDTDLLAENTTPGSDVPTNGSLFGNDTLDEEVVHACHEPFKTIFPVLDSAHFWIEGVALSTVACVGLLGNLITVIVIFNFDRCVINGGAGPHSNNSCSSSGAVGRSPFNTILMSLVAFDSFFLVFSIIDSAYFTSFRMPEPLWYKAIFPYVWYPLKNVVTNGCVFMVVAVAAERYHAICHPMKYKPYPTFYISLVVLVSVMVSLPKFFEFKHITVNNTLNYWTSDLNENASYVVFSSYHECAVIGVVPLIALCYLNYKIYIKIRKSAEIKNRYVGGGASRAMTSSPRPIEHPRRQTTTSTAISVARRLNNTNGKHRPASATSTTQVNNCHEIKLSLSAIFQTNELLPNDANSGEFRLSVIDTSVKRQRSSGASSLDNAFETFPPDDWKRVEPTFVIDSSHEQNSPQEEFDDKKQDQQNGTLSLLNPPLSSAVSAAKKSTRKHNITSSVVQNGRQVVSKIRTEDDEDAINSSQQKKDKRHFQSRREKSTGILVGIILVFVSCHVFRLGVQIYEIVSPTHGLQDHYHRCYEMKRLHVPAVVLILGNINHLFLVANSSVNFLIYCCLARRFRLALMDLLSSCKSNLCFLCTTKARRSNNGFNPVDEYSTRMTELQK